MTEQTTHFAGDLDTDVWELTLPEDEPPCEQTAIQPRCENPATLIRVAPCGHSRQVCTTHQFGNRPASYGVCKTCGQAWPMSSLRFVPL